MVDNKPILFYSNYCIHSNDLISRLQKMNVIDKFVLINVSKNKYKIPSIVKSVPTIFYNNKIFIDDNVELFIKNLMKENDSEDIDAFFPSEMNSGIGYSYSYIGDSEETNIKNNLMFIDDINKNSIVTPEEGDYSTANQKTNFEKFQAEREQDLKKIFSS